MFSIGANLRVFAQSLFEAKTFDLQQLNFILCQSASFGLMVRTDVAEIVKRANCP